MSEDIQPQAVKAENTTIAEKLAELEQLKKQIAESKQSEKSLIMQSIAELKEEIQSLKFQLSKKESDEDDDDDF